MLARVFSCAIVGLEGTVVGGEVDYSNGLPAVIVVDLPDAAVQESRERVQTAIKNAGLYFPVIVLWSLVARLHSRGKPRL